MDGYAVRADDVARASRAIIRVRLPVIADIPAGHPTECRDHARARSARITTGAMLPRGADAVVPVEDTDDSARGASELLKSVAIYHRAQAWAHMCARRAMTYSAASKC